MNYPIEKFERYVLGDIAELVAASRSAGKDIIDLSQINPDLGPHPVALEALVQATLRVHNHRYSASQGISKLRKEICSWAKKEFELELEADSEVAVTLGTKEGIAHLLLAIANSGDSIIIPSPSYPVHRSSALIAELKVVAVPLFDGTDFSTTTFSAENDGFFVRLEKALSETNPRPRFMLFNFPHNPTGSVANLSFFERLVEFAKAQQLILIHDFAYWGIAYDGFRPPSLLQVAGAKEVAIEFYSFSKSLSVPGWRIGACAGNELLIALLKKVKSFTDYGAFQPLQIAAISLLKNAKESLQEANGVYQSRRDCLSKGLEKLGFGVSAPSSGLCVWAKLPAAWQEMGALNFAKALLAKVGVAVCPGVGFDPDAGHYIRVSMIAEERHLRDALGRISSFLQEPQAVKTANV